MIWHCLGYIWPLDEVHLYKTIYWRQKFTVSLYSYSASTKPNKCTKFNNRHSEHQLENFTDKLSWTLLPGIDVTWIVNMNNNFLQNFSFFLYLVTVYLNICHLSCIFILTIQVCIFDVYSLSRLIILNTYDIKITINKPNPSLKLLYLSNKLCMAWKNLRNARYFECNNKSLLKETTIEDCSLKAKITCHLNKI